MRTRLHQHNNLEYLSYNLYFYESEFLVYGEVIQHGGVDPIIMLKTEEFGYLTVKTTKDQLLDCQNTLYKQWGIYVRGKRKIPTGVPYDLELVSLFGEYSPTFDPNLLDTTIKKIQSDMCKIESTNEFIVNIRGKYL